MKNSTTKREEMRKLLARWKSSGLSLRAFAAREGVRYQKLLYWKKRLHEESPFVPVAVVEDVGCPSPADAEVGIVSIWLANGISLEVLPSVDESDLVRVVRALSSC